MLSHLLGRRFLVRGFVLPPAEGNTTTMAAADRSVGRAGTVGGGSRGAKTASIAYVTPAITVKDAGLLKSSLVVASA